MRAQAICLAGSFAPAGIRYSPLKKAVEDGADLYLKDRERCRGDLPPTEYSIEMPRERTQAKLRRRSSITRPMQVTVQYFEGCPHWELAEHRLRAALCDIGHAEVEIGYQRVDSPEDAERLDFHGSPTILINGRDPFPARDMPPSQGCRVYQTEDGAQGAPSVPQLRYVLRSAT